MDFNNEVRFLKIRRIVTILLLGIVAVTTALFEVSTASTADTTATTPIVAQSMLAEIPERENLISMNVSSLSLAEALEVVAAKAKVGLSYRTGIIPDNEISLNVNNAPIFEILSKLLEGTDLEVLLPPSRDVIVISKSDEGTDELYQEIIRGQITDAYTGEPLPGVNVVIENTTTGVSTDLDGNFELTVSDLQQSLEVSYIGYVSQTIPIDGRTEINIQIQPEITGMDELVVVGYGTQRRSDLTGSISSVRPEEIEGQAFSNIEQGLQGRLSGVAVTHSSGEPGAPMEMQIRGIGTFGSNSPLYVLDGMTVQAEDMATINPNDIESIEVLKDASAAAIYGARAANGVVLITTKRGEMGAPRFEYNGYYGVQSFTDYIPMLNGEQMAELALESTRADGYPDEAAWLDQENIQHNTNWQEEAFQRAPMMNHSLSVSGGSENARYSFSGDYLDQEGVFVFNWLERYSARVNTEFDISDRLTIGESLSFSRTAGLNRGQGNNLDFAYMLGSSPTMRVYRPENEGGYAGPNSPETGVNNRDNIIGRRDMRRTYDFTNRLLGNAFVDYEFLDGLLFRLNFGLNARLSSDEQFVPTYFMDNRRQNYAFRSETRSEKYEYLLENTLTYVSEIAGEHPVTLLAGFTQENAEESYLSGYKRDFPSNELQQIDAATGDMTAGGNRSEWAIRSFIGRANFTFFDKYLLSATVRRDGSSRFGVQGDRWGNFPSFALGWLINREDFMPDIALLDEMKIRASWGKLGNQEMGNYVSQTTVSTNINYVLGGEAAPGAAVTSLGNPFLKWETTTQTNFGIDLEIFNNRLLFIADYFIKDTDDILLRLPISVGTGMARDNGPFQNAASVSNSGLEFEGTFRDRVGNLFYSISGNIATIKNEVTSLGGESAVIDFRESAYRYGAFTYNVVGKPMSNFYGWESDGIFQNQEEIDAHATQSGAVPGDPRYRDVNGDGIINDNDRTIIGSPFPDFTYGLSASFSYQNIDLSLSAYGVQGRELYNAQRAFLESVNGEHGQMATTLNRWQGEGTSNTIPRASRDAAYSNARSQSRFVEDASFLRLQNLQIGYTLPGELTEHMGIRNMRIYFNGQNLFTLTGYSNYTPDVRGGGAESRTTGQTDMSNPLAMGVDMGAYPVPRVLQFGIQTSF
ncbi:MAG: TonB-dependent receptor [Balneolaceae bacterium]